MFSNAVILDKIVAARAEGGNSNAVAAAKSLVAGNFIGRESFDVETPVNAVLNALDGFDREAALRAIDVALESLENPPVVQADLTTEAPATTGTVEDRVAALETEVARLKEIAARYV